MDLETQADHITHEPWQHCVRVNNCSPLSVGSSMGQRLEYSSLTYACCRDPGGITECCYHINTVGYSVFPQQKSRVPPCVPGHSCISYDLLQTHYTRLPASIPSTQVCSGAVIPPSVNWYYMAMHLKEHTSYLEKIISSTALIHSPSVNETQVTSV